MTLLRRWGLHHGWGHLRTHSQTQYRRFSSQARLLPTLKSSEDVERLLAEMYTPEYRSHLRGTLHSIACYEPPEAPGELYPMQINAFTPKSDWDFFVLNTVRAASDISVVSGQEVRMEPHLACTPQGSASQALQRWRREVLGKTSSSPDCAILTHGVEFPPTGVNPGLSAVGTNPAVSPTPLTQPSLTIPFHHPLFDCHLSCGSSVHLCVPDKAFSFLSDPTTVHSKVHVAPGSPRGLTSAQISRTLPFPELTRLLTSFSNGGAAAPRVGLYRLPDDPPTMRSSSSPSSPSSSFSSSSPSSSSTVAGSSVVERGNVVPWLVQGLHGQGFDPVMVELGPHTARFLYPRQSVTNPRPQGHQGQSENTRANDSGAHCSTDGADIPIVNTLFLSVYRGPLECSLSNLLIPVTSTRPLTAAVNGAVTASETTRAAELESSREDSVGSPLSLKASSLSLSQLYMRSFTRPFLEKYFDILNARGFQVGDWTFHLMTRKDKPI